jgi:hypothetical protein
MSRLLVASAAVCASAGLVGGIAPAGADSFPTCGPDQLTSVTEAIAHEQHDRVTQAPWNPYPIESNYDACADLSAVIVSIDMAKPTSPRQGLLFHRGTYIGTTTTRSRPFTTLDVAASTKSTAVVDFVSGRTCGTCGDGTVFPVRYYWNGITAVMADPIPPAQDWPIP